MIQRKNTRPRSQRTTGPILELLWVTHLTTSGFHSTTEEVRKSGPSQTWQTGGTGDNILLLLPYSWQISLINQSVLSCRTHASNLGSHHHVTEVSTGDKISSVFLRYNLKFLLVSECSLLLCCEFPQSTALLFDEHHQKRQNQIFLEISHTCL